MSHTQTENPNSQPSEADELRARVAKLEAQLQERLSADESQEAKIIELRRRNAELRSKGDNVDPALRPHLESDVAQCRDVVAAAAAELKKRPSDNALMLKWSMANRALKLAQEQLASQFPPAEVIPRSLSRLQSEQLRELRSALDAAKSAYMKNTRDPFAMLQFSKADREFKKFSRKLWAEFGIRISH